VAEKGILAALAKSFIAANATKTAEKVADECIKQAYAECPNYGTLVANLIKYGVTAELNKHCTLTAGVPIQAMLGKPVTSVADVLKHFGPTAFTLEWKYDGERAQIHLLQDGTIKIYSRNSEDHTGKYPDIIQSLPRAYSTSSEQKVSSFIIDCEVVAWHVGDKKILPFQTLSTRKRKDVDTSNISVQVCLFAFDLLSLNGRSYMQSSGRDRRKLLRDTFHAVPGKFAFAESLDTSDVAEIEAFLHQAVKSSCEGLMVKNLRFFRIRL